MPTKKVLQEKLTEITKNKSRVEEEKFYVKFSETQLNAVLLLILGDTFFVQGATRFLENISLGNGLMKFWFFIVMLSILFLILSVGFITVGGVLAGLKSKRIFNLFSFLFFIAGILFFVGSLFCLMFLLLGGGY